MSAVVEASVETLLRWWEHPAAFVREVFEVEPDAWQHDALEAFPHSPRIAMKACKGPGKTAVLAWLVWNFLLTRPHSKVAATAITKDNLDDNLWTELAKWQKRSPLLKATFSWQKTRIVCNEHPETWWASARTWSRSADSQQQADTLAGLHADYLLFVLDESGGIPDAVMAAAEGGLANVVAGTGREAHIVQAGNPTHLEGPLYRACTTGSTRWHVIEITSDPDDPKRTPRVSVEWAQAQIDEYGRDSPWVLVNVFGRFPPASINALIGPDEVRDAMRRHYHEHQYAHAAKILGVDVAREGDDASVIFSRQGNLCWKPQVLRNVDGFQGAARVNARWSEWEADACFVDNTGGFGASWIDAMRNTLGRQPTPVNFSSEPMDRGYYNKRTEMYFLLCKWIREGGALPDCPELVGELTRTHYTFKGDRLLLEDKAIVKAAIGRSPDHTDALALTFAYPVIGRAGAELRSREDWRRRRRMAPVYDDPRLALLNGTYD